MSAWHVVLCAHMKPPKGGSVATWRPQWASPWPCCCLPLSLAAALGNPKTYRSGLALLIAILEPGSCQNGTCQGTLQLRPPMLP